MTLTLDLLRTFLLVVRSGGDAAQAATQLGINQPSMSKRLRYLQHAGPLLERPWLERQGKSWSLTAEGQRVLPAVGEIIARSDQLSTFISTPAEPKIRFACGQQAAKSYVRDAVREFRKRDPETRLHIETMRGSARIESVANGSLDLATVSHAEAEIHRIARRELHTEKLCEDRLVLVCAEKSKWSAAVRRLPKTKVSSRTLAEFPLVIPNRDSGVRQWLDAIFRQEGVFADLQFVLETGGWSTIISYVEDGFGVGIVSDAAVQSHSDLIVRQLDAAVFPPRITRLICRWLEPGNGSLDLSSQAAQFRDILLRSIPA